MNQLLSRMTWEAEKRKDTSFLAMFPSCLCPMAHADEITCAPTDPFLPNSILGLIFTFIMPSYNYITSQRRKQGVRRWGQLKGTFAYPLLLSSRNNRHLLSRYGKTTTIQLQVKYNSTRLQFNLRAQHYSSVQVTETSESN